MVVDLEDRAHRTLANCDCRKPGARSGDPIDLTTAKAYALQAMVARLREERGEKVIGYKIGCTSKTIQAQLGVSEPIFGRLFDTECHPSGVHLSLRGMPTWRSRVNLPYAYRATYPNVA